MRRLSLLVVVLASLLVGASAAQLRQVAIVELPGRPGFDTLAWANGKLVIAHSGADKLDVFDPARRRVVAQVEGLKDPRGIAVDEKAGKVYVANAAGNSIAVVDSKDWKLENTIAVPQSPNALLLAPGGRLYTSNWRHRSVSVVDLGTSGVAATIDVGGIPEQLVWDPDQQLVFVTVQDRAEVLGLDSGNNIAKRFKLLASQPTGLALDAKRRRLYVAVRYAVLALNADTGAEVARIPASAGTDTLWFDEGSRRLYAGGTGGWVSMITTDGQHVAEHEFKTEVRGRSLAFDPEKKMVYMPGGREGRSKLVILKRVERPEGPAVNARGSAAQPSSAGPNESAARR